jgi:hypothetical protein
MYILCKENIKEDSFKLELFVKLKIKITLCLHIKNFFKKEIPSLLN